MQRGPVFLLKTLGLNLGYPLSPWASYKFHFPSVSYKDECGTLQRFVKLKWKIVYDFISIGTQQVVTEGNVVIITVVVFRY